MIITVIFVFIILAVVAVIIGAREDKNNKR